MARGGGERLHGLEWKQGELILVKGTAEIGKG